MTHKQQEAINNMVENGGNVSKAMRDSGYSLNTAKTPSKLTRSKSYIELLDEKLPNDFLLTALRNDIDANPGNRRAYLELAFKMKGLTSLTNAESESEIRIDRFSEIIARGKEKYGL
ncbi:MAG: hypothetical protein QG623_548 [Patescibacteria group bacterium]|jgi:hypothetical protein|nr:hypothetical protein [Patescibacteria group bacterium]